MNVLVHSNLLGAAMDCNKPSADRLPNRSISSIAEVENEEEEGVEEEEEEGVEENEVEEEEEEEDVSSLTAGAAVAAVDASRVSRSRDRASKESARAWHTS